jgi:predicted RNase H-like HicB family nuclease
MGQEAPSTRSRVSYPVPSFPGPTESGYVPCMSWELTIELDREDDGRWIAEVRQLPGVLAYGATEAEAFTAAQALALRVVADQVAHSEVSPGQQLKIAIAAA